MKTTIENVKKTILKNLYGANIRRLYIEDEDTPYQRIVVFGVFFNKETKNYWYFHGTIIGALKTEKGIMNGIDIFQNRYEALFKFTSRITI